jgi:hypothetical protein
MKTVTISPTKKASQRTKNRIRENGPVFEFIQERNTSWLLRAGEWFGWLPRNEFSICQPMPKARVNKDGFMGSASREHKVKKGKGSFRRRKKHKKPLDK